MTAAVHILCGPSGSGKTRRLRERFRECCGQGTGALWLAPTRRAADALRAELLDDSPACLGAALLTFQDFADEVVRVNDPAARPFTDSLRRQLVEDVVAELQRRGELSHFERVHDTRGFGEGVSALLAELKRAGVRPAEFARAAYRRGYDGARAGRTLNGRTISLKERQCARVFARYQRLADRHRLLDAEDRLRLARDLLADGRRRPFDGVQAVFADGFTGFARAEHGLLDALAEFAEEFWLALTDEAGDHRAELFDRPRATLAQLQRLGPDVVTLPIPPAAPGELPARPTGLAHVERQLFRPLRAVEVSARADGLLCLEAPGALGEARMVARQIKALLRDGVAAEEVVVTARDLAPYADLLREVFAEYGIPADVEGTDPLARNPAVATLLRAARLPDEDWPFAAVTALLRSGYFRPAWPEAGGADVPLHAEALLRLLGEPRGRDAYLAAVRRWAESPPPGLEDEQAEESRRRRTHELAVRCRPFLQRFFRAWEGAPDQAPLGEHARWLRVFADDVGLPRAADDSPRDRAALARLWDELARWADLEARLHGPRELDGKVFQRRLAALAAEAGLARTPRGPGRVRVLSAGQARHLDADHVFLMGLGERGFPRLTAAEPIFDEQERQALRQAGVGVACVSDRMPDEMLLFYRVVTRARRRLVLSYPAVDEKGQPLLPSSFLGALLDCFAPGAVPTERRSMLLDRFERDIPLSPTEHRVRVAAGLADEGADVRFVEEASLLRPDLAANLADAAELARERLSSHEYGPYDGLFRGAAVAAEVASLFGPERVFSPTALEDYVACPFRFFLGHVLRLEPLEEPREEIEVTRRGQAFHRALSRLHKQLRGDGVHRPAPEVEGQLLRQLGDAVEEDVARAPSPASKELWRLEGRRLLRAAARYGGHWTKFVGPWLEVSVSPEPLLFEVDFGLPSEDGAAAHGPLVIRTEEAEVRVSGRIDRVDVAELPDGGVGFWVIDYKTGRAGHYTGSDLAEFRRLQLTLYALAVEEVLLAGRGARPLGLAYWLVTDTGPKVALPGRGVHGWFREAERWGSVRERLRRWVATLAAHIRKGAFPLCPRSEHCTQTCDYSQVCRISQSRGVGKVWSLPLPLVPA